MQLGWVNVTFCHTPTIYLSHMRQKQNDQAPRQRVLLIQIVCEQQDVWPLTQARAVLWESLFWGLRCWLWATVNTSLGSGHSLMRHYHVFITLTRRKTHGKSGRNRLAGSSRGVRAVRKSERKATAYQTQSELYIAMKVWPWATLLTCMGKTLDSCNFFLIAFHTVRTHI